MKPHWLPVAYLQFFSATTPRGRKSAVHVATASEARLEPVKRLCADDDFYSRTDPIGAELGLGKVEGIYSALIRKASKSKALDADERLDCLLCLLHLYLRNPILELQTDRERADLLHPLHFALLWHEVAGIADPSDPADVAALRVAIQQSWQVAVLRVERERLITSDNPAKLFRIGGELIFALIPATPHLLLAGVRTARGSLGRSILSRQDVEVLNSIQVRTCIREVYTDRDLSPDLAQIQTMIGMPGPRYGRIGHESFTSQLHQYTADELSFVQVDRSRASR